MSGVEHACWCLEWGAGEAALILFIGGWCLSWILSLTQGSP